uniref:At2g35280-like TPR domain-containing protein n=1 Tax=Brassica campestris TaxID=3711 RepID=M4FJ04_BRACM
MDSSPDPRDPSSQQDSNDVSIPMESEPEIKQTDDSSDGDSSDAEPATYFRHLSLKYFASEPLRMVDQHTYLMGSCLEYNNPEAHYIEGINQYFFRKRRVKGIRHLRRSAKGKYDKGTYLCGILMLCTGKIKEGKRVLDTLDWQRRLSTSERCWVKIKKTLSVYPIDRDNKYLNNMARLKPPKSCDLQNNNHLCKDCYYFLRVEKFVQYVHHR